MATILKRAGDDVMDLAIADGLKDLLSKYALTKHDVLSFSVGELASLLEIDEYVAKLIVIAARSQSLETTLVRKGGKTVA
ncbi:MAG TPA: hypothetical protein VH415_03990 [Nitrososphaeraceae archaeon]